MFWRQLDTIELEVCFSYCLQMYICLEPFKLTYLRDLAGSASSGTCQVTRGSLCSTLRSVETPKGPAMASEVCEGRGYSWDVTSSSFGATDVVVVGHDGLSLGPAPKERGPLAHHTRGRSPGGRRSQLASFVDPGRYEVNKLACRGTHHGQLQLLESLALQAGCISF